MKQNYLQSGLIALVTTAVLFTILTVAGMFVGKPSNNDFAVISVQSVIWDSDAGIALTKQYQAEAEKARAGFEEAYKVLSEEVQQLNGRKNYISEKEFNEESVALRVRQLKAQEKLQKNEGLITEAIRKFSQQILDKSTKIAKGIKADRGFKYIMNASSLVAHDADVDRSDITTEVVKRLNEEMPTVKFEVELLDYVEEEEAETEDES